MHFWTRGARGLCQDVNRGELAGHQELGLALPALLRSLANGDERLGLGNLKIDWYGTLVEVDFRPRPVYAILCCLCGGY